MHVVSVNVGLPRNVVWKGMTVQTGIFKEPVDGRVSISKLNLTGDQQADLTVHGGAAKALHGWTLHSQQTCERDSSREEEVQRRGCVQLWTTW